MHSRVCIHTLRLSLGADAARGGARVRRARIKTYLSTMYTRDRVQGLRRSNRAHETPMRSRRFVALFGGGAADGPGERRVPDGRGQGRGSPRGREGGRVGGRRRRARAGGSVVAIWKRPTRGRDARRSGAARICARSLAGNNEGQQPAGSTTTFLARSRNNATVLNLAVSVGITKRGAPRWTRLLPSLPLSPAASASSAHGCARECGYSLRVSHDNNVNGASIDLLFTSSPLFIIRIRLLFIAR